MELNNQWFNTMQSLKNCHQVIADLLVDKKVAYVDIPIHFNVGDLLIYLGTEEFFKNNAINVIYRSDAKHVRWSKLKDADVILMHGGGNFGDLYDSGCHQSLREEIIQRFENKVIVCLPQTIYFNSEEREERSAKIFSKHSNFHFFVRDKKSFKIAEKFSNFVKLMPDMAHSLHPLVDVTEAGPSNIFPKKKLNLVRVDIEGNGHIKREIDKKTFDWQDIITVQDFILKRLYDLLIFITQNKSNMLWESLSRSVFFKSASFFNQYDIVYTDRLHGVIFASLLGKEVFLYDNSYGKNSTYYDCWLKPNPFISVLK
ncbi:polysaccharide pyruvyl transferase family protein [Shewanella sp. SP2S2-6]|uniref:polysaccharide pyruvyl transferase family protein n=1 Tax=Shewanella sp. SP2S2-6 TaxID=3063540 RepID=UPI00288E056D|nr:polysaccharide pyruvyl transferase family protein [Shewanella sp. SP2S2-6]MDT3296875.1 polysaccharide pyruvyl transferase family protein [Shewanella sp. SP2S2-6]